MGDWDVFGLPVMDKRRKVFFRVSFPSQGKSHIIKVLITGIGEATSQDILHRCLFECFLLGSGRNVESKQCDDNTLPASRQANSRQVRLSMHLTLEMSTLTGHDCQRAIIRLIRMTFGVIIAQSGFAYKLQKSPVKGGRQIDFLKHTLYIAVLISLV